MTARPVDRIDVFVVGAMKAGTTAMCEWLDAQPGVAVSDPKEPSIYVSDLAVDDWSPRIQDLFPGAAHGDLRVDGSTDYAKFPSIDGVPERVIAAGPSPRIIYMMRQPVERLISQYRFEWYLGNHRRSLDQELNLNAQLLDNSRYGLQLTRWLRCVDPGQILLVFAETFAQRPEEEMKRVLDFLGLATSEGVVPDRLRSNESSELVRRTWARRLLRGSRLGQVLRPLVPQGVVDAYKTRLLRASQPHLGDTLRLQLEQTIDDDLVVLADLTQGPPITCRNWHTITSSWTPVLAPH